MSRNHFNWPQVLLWSAFFADSFIWSDLIFGYDLRSVYIVVGVGLFLGLLRGWVLLAREQINLLIFLALLSSPSFFQDISLFFNVFFQLIAGAILGSFIYLLISRKLGLYGAVTEYRRIAAMLGLFVILDQLAYQFGGIALSQNIFGWLPIRLFDRFLEHDFYRASGFLYEPSQVAIVVGPALLVSMRRREYRLALLLSTALLVSFSSLSYIAILLSLLFIRASRRTKWIYFLSTIFISMGMLTIPSLNERFIPLMAAVIETMSLGFLGSAEVGQLGGTVGTLVANTYITINGLIDSPFFGHGISSFRHYYDFYLDTVIPGASSLETLHNKGGSSLFLRMLFELGLVGTILLFWAFIRRIQLAKRNTGVKITDEQKDVILMTSVFFILSLIRKDAFVSIYFWFMLTLFILVTRKNHGSLKR